MPTPTDLTNKNKYSLMQTMKDTNLKHIMDRPSGGALVANIIEPGVVQDFWVATILQYYRYIIRILLEVPKGT